MLLVIAVFPSISKGKFNISSLEDPVSARYVSLMDMNGVKSEWRRIPEFKLAFNVLYVQSSAWCYVSSINFL